MTKAEKVPILGIFSPKTILMFRVGIKKIRVGRPTGTTHTFHLSLGKDSITACFLFYTLLIVNHSCQLKIFEIKLKL